jgi:hypothetical protein
MLDFNDLLTSHLGIADEAFLSKMSFERTVGFIKYLADELKLSLSENLLVVELKEGVFIRSQSSVWCEELTRQSKENKIQIEAIGVTRWNDLTRNYRAPINSFGDERLVRWKVGFF